MAEKTDRQLCSICLNDFNKPKILECSHTFCFICLEDYINRTSDNNLFPCPLCRREITVPEGGVEEFTSNVDVVQTSDDDMERTAIPPCEVCKRDVESEFKCEDCEQYLCSSCRTTHDSLKVCKDHVVVDVNEVKETPREDNSGYTDVCSHHPRKKSRCYCKDCQQAVCSDCFLSNHYGHSYLDLHNDDVRKKEREYLKNLKQDLETGMIRHQNYLDSLRSIITDINTSSVVACDNVDKQVDKICCRIKTLGEDIKEKIEENRVNEEEKLTKLVKVGETLIEDLKASIKCTGNILEDKLMVEVIERKVKVEKEKEASKERKLDIPDVNYPWFEEREIDEKRLLEQLGKLEMKEGPTFTTSFNFDDLRLQSGRQYNGDNYSISGLSWYISVAKKTVDNKDTLGIYLYLNSSMKSCDAKYSPKLINYKDSSQSVERHGDHRTFTDNGEGWGWRLIDWSRFSNKQNGFLTDDNKFTVQAMVKVLKIEHY